MCFPYSTCVDIAAARGAVVYPFRGERAEAMEFATQGDKTLRPAVEDLIGAGAVIAHLSGRRSPEALAAEAVYQQARARLHDFLPDCGSGRELIARGFAADVDLAAQLDSCDCAPRLVEGAYIR